MGCGASSGANVVDTVGGPEADAEVKAKTEEEARKKAAEEAEEARIKAEAETKAKADAEVKEEADRKKAAADATAPITDSDAADAGAAHGAVGIDHVWQRRLQRAMDETAPPGSFEDAMRPLTQHFPEIDFEDLRAVAQGLREAWRERLYSESGGFNLPETYHVDWAIAIRVYTMSDPPVYRIVNREMFNPKRRKPGGNHSISDGLSACMPFIRLLKDALENLPESYVFRGQVRRGVKWSFPSPDDHDPVGYFVVGQRVMWYEFKSTSTKQEVMTREHFCGVTAGPRTIFIIDVLLAFAIKKFSFFQGVENEHEVLLLPLSEFVVVHAARNIIDPHETVSVQRSGFPDTVHLRQVEPVEGRTQEEADTALAREIQQQLDLEHAVEMESKKRKDAEAQQKAEAEARQRVEAEAQQRAKEAEAQLKVEENARQKAAEEQARIQAEQDAKRAKEEKKEEGDHVLELPEIVLRKLENAALSLSEEDSLKVLLACIQYGLVKARKGEDKELLMVIGNTGAGKSTLINYLHGCKFQMVRKGSKRIVCVSADSQVSEMMKIGHTNQSMTFIPDLEADELFTYLDCPGFLDNRGAEINIANAVNIKSAVCLAHAVRVLVLINYNSLEADRGRGLRELLKVLIELFGTIDALRQACSSILLGVSKVHYHSYGEEMTLDDVRGVFEDTTGLDADSVTVLRHLSQRMFIYDPLDGGSESWIGRQGLIKLIQDLPPLREPRYAFHTVLTVEDFEVLRAITRNLHDQILEQMNKDEFERVGISLGSLEEIEQVDNAFVTRLVMEVKTQLSLPLRALEDKAFQNASYENFEEAAGTLIRLQTAAQHLPGRLGDDAAQRHARALAWVEKRKKEVEDMRALMEANKDANKRAQQLEVQMQMLMKQSEADKENIQRLTDAFREQELKWEQERQKAKTAFEDELRQYQDRMRSASEEEKQALEAQMQQLQQERAMSEKLYEKQRLEEKQRNEKLVADLQQKNAETERKVKEAEEAAAAERQKQLEAAERVRAEEARRKEEEAAKAKAAAEAKVKADAEVKRKEEEAAKQKAAAESKAKSQAEAKQKEELEHIDAPTQQEADAFRAALPGLCSPTGDLAALLADMQRLRTQPQAQAAALDALADLMAGAGDWVQANGKTTDDNIGAIFELGGLEAGSAAMQAHASERAVQRAACAMFDSLASASPHATAIRVKARELGVIEGVLAALAAFDSDRELVEAALAALRNLMLGSDDNRARVVAGGGIEVMLAALAAFDSDRELVKTALAALRILMIGSADNRARVVAAGGVEGVLKALETFPDDADGVVYWAVSALDQLSQGGPAALARLRALGAAAYVRAAMEVPGVRESAQKYGQEILERLGC